MANNMIIKKIKQRLISLKRKKEEERNKRKQIVEAYDRAMRGV